MKAEIDMIRRVHSYVIAAAIWGVPGINITVKGVKTYMLMNHDDLWWLMLIVAALRYAIKPIDKK